MNIQLSPVAGMQVEKGKVGNVPVLILRPDGNKVKVPNEKPPGYRLAFQKPYPAALYDCYHVSKLAAAKFNQVIAEKRWLR